MNIKLSNLSDRIRMFVDSDKKHGKSRFSILEKKGKLIAFRANQGHSMECVKLEKLCGRKVDTSKHKFGYHSTRKNAYVSIMINGLEPRGRPVHMAVGLDDDVKSGIRRNCDWIFEVDLVGLSESGVDIYISDNDVILCNETISREFLKLV